MKPPAPGRQDGSAADGAGDARAARRRLAAGLAVATLLLATAGLAVGSDGVSPRAWAALLTNPEAGFIIGEIRAPRTLGAWLAGALLGLAGALAQGLFRNPLADPYLLGTAAGAGLGVVLVLAAGSIAGHEFGPAAVGALARLGLVGAAFAGALGGMLLALLLARGAHDSARLLLAGVVVGVMLSALGDLVTVLAPEALRGRQAFLLGNTGFVGWAGCATLAAGLAATLPLAWRLARVLDALALGDDTAASLGLSLSPVRGVLVATLALATGCAVSQTGLVAFVGLVAPHLVRRLAPSTAAWTLLAGSAAGGVLLLAADVASRWVLAPRELPVGVLTAVIGGGYLLWLLRRGGAA